MSMVAVMDSTMNLAMEVSLKDYIFGKLHFVF
jgi:hypothetical protein